MPKKIQDVVLAGDPEQVALLIREELARCGVALESLVGEANVGLKRGGEAESQPRAGGADEPLQPASERACQSPGRSVSPESRRGPGRRAKGKKRRTPN